jgi:cytochrome b pre-mRNA-processing protein 3
MFKDMDRSLREMGASDIAVGPKVRRMAEVFYGRSRVYSEALGRSARRAGKRLIAALARNVFPGGERPAADGPGSLGDYVLAEHRALAEQPIDEMLSGEAGFAPAPD